MSSILAIAQMTFIDARRNRVLWSLLFFCIVLVVTSFLLQEVTIAAFDRVVRDTGLATINAFEVILAIFLGVSTVTREIERKTVFSVLTKPVSRFSYLLGKLIGVWVTMVACLGLMLVAFLIDLRMYRGATAPIVFEAFWLILVEGLVIASVAILASTFSTSLMAAFMSVAVTLAGHLGSDVYLFSRRSSSALTKFAGKWLFFILPNLERLNLKSEASTLTPVAGKVVLLATGYGMLYATAFFLLSVAIFQTRDLK